MDSIIRDLEKARTGMTGKTVTLYETPENDHGCRGRWVEVKIITRTGGIVLGGGSCNSCWQTGCTTDEPPIPVGSLVMLPHAWPEGLLVWHLGGLKTYRRGFDYSLSEELPVTWENAAHWAGFSHNILDRDVDYPAPDTTLCTPHGLVVSQKPE